MSDQKPTIAGRSPQKVTLEAGKKYAYCTCGLSTNQPFCDGGHKGTGMSPKVFIAENNEDVWMCLCKQTGCEPKCDGTHKTLPAEG